MATLVQIHNFALGNPDLQQKFKAARIQTAWDILGEAAPSAARVAWRNKILNDPDKHLIREYIWFLSTISGAAGAAASTASDATITTNTKALVDTWAAHDAANP